MFFSKSSFEMVYFEAIANALDANATEINIIISYEAKKGKSIENLSLQIKDNGVGFDDIRYDKFCKLFNVEESTHKGLGRLVYLCYFDTIQVESIFDQSKKRTFTFSESFNGKDDGKVVPVQNINDGTILKMSGFSGEKIHKTDYINPSYLKKAILEYFYPRFYKESKINNKDITVNISTIVSGVTHTETITTTEIPNFLEKSIDYPVNAFSKLKMYYYINEVDNRDSRVVTGISVDDRTVKLDVITEEMPTGYDMVFLLVSESIVGDMMDGSRQNILEESIDINSLKNTFRTAIADVVNEKVPKIVEINQERISQLNKRYPHLQGLFETGSIGYISQNDILKKAQEQFFKAQKEILCADTLTDEQFNKTLDLSARSLTEYVLFRQYIINRMRSLDGKNKESELHNLLVPRYSDLKKNTFIQDIYQNNVWVIDDKFMSYQELLSEAEMTKVINCITGEDNSTIDRDRPDITLFFSSNPETSTEKIDVVVVELKRLGISAEENSIVEFQLNTRTRRLAEYYDDKIQRLWFYGIVEFNDDYETHLVDSHFRPLFSSGNVYFRSEPIFLDKTQTKSVIQNAYIMDFKALVEDANSRNEAFLKVLQSHFKQQQQS